MNKSKFYLLILCLFCLAGFVSCDRYPIEALVGIYSPIDSWPDPWYLYDDQINTKGNLAPQEWDWTDAWVRVNLKFDFTEGVKRGQKCIKFSWPGYSGSNPSDRKYFGFGLKARDGAGKVALNSSGYTSLKFWIKGTLHNNCYYQISIPDTDVIANFGNEIGSEIKRRNDSGVIDPSLTIYTTHKITSDWQEVEIAMTNPVEVEYLLAMSLAPMDDEKTCNGSDGIFLDDIRLVK